MVYTNAGLHRSMIRSDQDVSISAADPHGLISSFIRCPPHHKTTPNDIFVIWMLSHRHHTTAEAALAILDSYGGNMLQSGSDWVESLRELFLDIAARSAPSTASHAGGE